MTGQIGLFESTTPWGPWATIAYYDNWGGFNESAGAGNGMYFPSKWISSDGQSLWAVFSGLGAFDSFNVAKAVLRVNNAQPQISTPVAGTVLSPGQSITAGGTGAEPSLVSHYIVGRTVMQQVRGQRPPSQFRKPLLPMKPYALYSPARVELVANICCARPHRSRRPRHPPWVIGHSTQEAARAQRTLPAAAMMER